MNNLVRTEYAVKQMRKLTKPEYGNFLKHLGCAESILITFQFTSFSDFLIPKGIANHTSFHLATRAG